MGDQVSERKMDLASWQENWVNSADFQFGLAELNNVVAREELLRIAAARLQESGAGYFQRELREERFEEYSSTAQKTKLETVPNVDEENAPKAGRQRPPKIEA